MRSASKKVACVVIAALLASSPATAATVQSVAPVAQTQSPWLTLSMLTPVSGVTLAQSAAAAAQPDAPPPPPPPTYDGGIPTPPIPVIIVFLSALALAIYIATKKNNNNGPNSPA